MTCSLAVFQLNGLDDNPTLMPLSATNTPPDESSDDCSDSINNVLPKSDFEFDHG